MLDLSLMLCKSLFELGKEFRRVTLPSGWLTYEQHNIYINDNCKEWSVKADDLYRGSMQFEDHRRTALQCPPCSLDPMPLPTIRRF